MRTTARRRLLAGLLTAATGAALALVPSPAQADSTDFLADRENPARYPHRQGSAVMNGTTYARSVVLNLSAEDAGDTVQVDYALAGTCRTLTSAVGLSTENARDLRARFQVLADGVVRHEHEADKGVVTPVTVDVTGAQTVRFVVTVVRAAFFVQEAVFGDAAVTCTGATPSSLTAATSATTVTAGSAATLSGVVADAGGSPVAGQAVEVRGRENGQEEFARVTTAVTDSAGRWSAAVRPRYSTRYQVAVPATSRRAEIAAPTQPVVAVRSVLSINAQRLGVREYRFFGTLRPAREGRTVALFRRSGGREVLVSRTTVDSRGVYDIRRTFTGSGRFDVLVRFAADSYSSAAVSPVRPTTVH